MTAAKKMPETLTLTDAQQRLGVARNTLWRVIKKYNVPTFNDLLDSRVALLHKRSRRRYVC